MQTVYVIKKLKLTEIYSTYNVYYTRPNVQVVFSLPPKSWTLLGVVTPV